ncbi:MAG: hypothetical protein RLZZ86_823 [Cyanobacteriota bacterium]|jgi:hypothetical protein
MNLGVEPITPTQVTSLQGFGYQQISFSHIKSATPIGKQRPQSYLTKILVDFVQPSAVYFPCSRLQPFPRLLKKIFSQPIDILKKIRYII